VLVNGKQQKPEDGDLAPEKFKATVEAAAK
jgi:hypothetical protein